MRLIFFIMLLIALPGTEEAHAWETWTPRKSTAYVVRVEEGNLLAVSELWGKKEADYAISLYGIGIPTETQPFGKQARQKLLQLLPRGERVIVSIVGEESSDVVSALVQAGGHSVNTVLLAEGLAWVDRSTCKAMFCRRWHIQENMAIKERRGIWSLNMSSPPWQWGGNAETSAKALPRGKKP